MTHCNKLTKKIAAERKKMTNCGQFYSRGSCASKALTKSQEAMEPAKIWFRRPQSIKTCKTIYTQYILTDSHTCKQTEHILPSSTFELLRI